MDAKRHARVSDLFARVCELGAEERKALLEQVCAGDPELRAEVESLLAHDEKPAALLHTAEMHERIRILLDSRPVSDQPDSRPTRIGAYKILRLLGEGGQGVVYAAEQQTPRRTVALKVLKGGVYAGPRGVRHFLREIQALAALSHPGIATIYEAGRTDDGQHFLAMELVAGESIDTFVRENQLALRECLELFCKVCDAVHYAHENGLIHRDLKPRNVLVTADGAPKILDFGLVRMTHADQTRASTDLGSGEIVGSLGYMSPEQACGKNPELGVHSDVYSLGVILYELVTGQRPYAVGNFLPDAVRTICETAPRRPGAINRALRGDLEAIVLKVLEKEPSRRYQSASELAQDLRRYLRGEPVTARRPSALYVLTKKVRKRPVVAALCALGLVLGIAGPLSGLWLKQRRIAGARSMACSIQQRLEVHAAERVIGEARSLIDTYPNLPDARLVWAQASFRAGRELDNPTLVGQAILVLRSGLKLDPSQENFGSLLDEMYQLTAHTETAGQSPPAAYRASDTVDAWYLRSLATLDLGKATWFARQAVERDSRHLLALSRLAHLCERTGDFDCALHATQRLIEMDDEYLWTWFQGEILMGQGRYQQALETYDFLARDNPAGNHSARGLAYLCLEDFERAVEAYTNEINVAVRPESTSWPRYKRATPLWILGRREEAAADYRAFRKFFGQAFYADARLFFLRHDQARLLEQRGESATARLLLEDARTDLQAARRGVEGGSWLAEIFACLAGEQSPAELIAAADPRNPEQVCEGFYYAAEVSLLRGEIEQAREWFRGCVDSGLAFDPNQRPLDPMAEYHLARWRLRHLEPTEG